MRIKSYYARTVEEAVALARQELGADAMLVNSRKAPVEARHLGEYEVVFAATPAPGPAERAGAALNPPQTVANSDRLSREVADLRKQLEGMRRTLTRSAVAPAWSGQSTEFTDAYAVLTANDVSPELARELVQEAEARAGGPQAAGRTTRRSDTHAFQRALVEAIQARCTAAPVLGRSGSRPSIVALVGPPGAGKTSTLVKLAVNYGLTCRRPTMLISVDTYRVAAAEQLRAFATILGVGFQVMETVGALAQSLEENRGKDLILIDTPGLGFTDMDHSADLGRFLSSRSDIDTHLVLPASMKASDLSRAVDAYDVFRPQRLIFTRLDETGSFGPILNEAARTGRALSFFSSGQRIPEDLEAASPERVAQLLLNGETGQALSAA